ncbi:MAG: AAA family ATPase [Planctomycetota bacterium]
MQDLDPSRVVIVGNSGAGKSTLAERLAQEHDLARLDLDTIAWDPGPARRPLERSQAELEAFTAQHPRWVIEGCYADLAELLRDQATLLVFLDPGVERCLAHNAARPWEPHKYASKEAQDRNLDMLQTWVRGYAERDDACSLGAHEALFAEWTGAKRRVADGDEVG